MTDIEWLLFIAQLPATPSSLRVRVWRKLRDSGAASLQNGVWILPRNEENTKLLERLIGFVRQNEASGQVFTVQGINRAVITDILERFRKDRDEEYTEFLEQSDGFIAELEKETQKKKFTFAELEETEANFDRLEKWLRKIQKRDFQKTEKSKEATTALQTCRQRLNSFAQRTYAQEGMEFPADSNLTEDNRSEETEDHDI